MPVPGAAPISASGSLGFSGTVTVLRSKRDLLLIG
jgi:hypothetical protein